MQTIHHKIALKIQYTAKLFLITTSAIIVTILIDLSSL